LRFHSTKFLFAVASDLICWSRCGLVGKSQSMLLIKFLLTILLFRFYNSKSYYYRLKWNCRKESWWIWYHCFPSPGRVVLCGRRDKRRRQWHRCHLIHRKKLQKIRKEEEKGAYLQAPTFATILKLLLLSHSACHHVDAPLAFTLLLPPRWSSSCWGTPEAPVDFTLLKLWATYLSLGGRWVGRKKGGRWELPKNNLGSGVGQKKINKKKVPRKKKLSYKKKSSWEKKEQKKKKKYWPSKLTPGEQFHPIHEIPELDFLDGALVGAGSLKPAYILQYRLKIDSSFHTHLWNIINSHNQNSKHYTPDDFN
jgi:hypothetical protein